MSKTISSRASWDLDIAVRPSASLDDQAAALQAWFAQRLSPRGGVRIVELSRPVANGGSSTTLFVTLDLPGGSDPRRNFVVRSKPTSFNLFLRDNFRQQFELLRFLRSQSDVPVPDTYFYEADPEVLGAPFWVMERVIGEVPPDTPSYHTAGFLYDAAPEMRRAVWESGLGVVARIAQVDPAGLPSIVRPDPGETGADENLRHWSESLHWASQSAPPPLLTDTMHWLLENRPADLQSRLSWGDARIGNMIFRDGVCVAAIDWETAGLADPQLDLAHWLLMDDFWAKYLGVTPLAGFGSRDETIALWELKSGFKANHLGWHEIYASFRLSVIQERVRSLRGDEARIAGIIDDNGDTIAIRQLRDIIARVRPAL